MMLSTPRMAATSTLSLFPRPRAAVAAVVVGQELLVQAAQAGEEKAECGDVHGTTLNTFFLASKVSRMRVPVRPKK